MKILAIRVKNLASLGGEFAIDFERQPLASAGLFAISGPTGAGKSTLLDALCLALYDRTPRLQQAGSRGVQLRDASGDTLPPHDPRNLLRRGAAEGYAEVDFAGSDGRAYRSRWSVRRARGRTDGRLQASEMELYALKDGQRLGGTKSEVLEIVVQKLGLGFEQFTRAVLLAQNEFSVFLKAPDDERAALLETLTGTDEFSRISVRAFERAKQEKIRLDELKNRLALAAPLPLEQRQALEAERRELEQKLAEGARQKAEIDDRLNWHRQDAQLQAAAVEAEASLQRAQAEQLAAGARRERLALLDAMQEARPLFADCDRLKDESGRQAQALEIAEREQAEAETRDKRAQLALTEARVHADAADKRRADLEPDLAAARALDAEIEVLAPPHRQKQLAAAQAAEARKAAEAALAEKRKDWLAAGQNLAECAAWLDANGHLASLSREWPRWDTLLKQARDAAIQRGQAVAALAAADRALAESGKAHSESAATLSAMGERFAEAEREYKTALDAAGRYDAEALAGEHGRWSARRDALRQAEALWSEQTRLAGERADKIRKREQQAAQMRHLEATRSAAGENLPALAAAYEQARKMSDLARLACSDNVEKLRANLQDGSECPVCGALTHPFAGGRHPFADQLAALDAEVKACEARHKQGEKQDSLAAQELAQIARQDAELAAEVEGLAVRIGALQQQWTAIPLAAELSDDDPVRTGIRLRDASQDAEKALAALAVDLKAMSDLNKARDAARTALDETAGARQAAQDRLAAAESAVKEKESGRQQAGEHRDALDLQVERLLAELDSAFADTAWRQAWAADAEAFYRRSRKEAEDWQARQARRDRLDRDIALLDTQIGALRQNADEAAARAAENEALFASADGELSAKRTRRLALLEGRPVRETEEALARAATLAKAGAETAAAAANAAAAGLAALRARTGQLGDELLRRQAALRSAEDRLADWLSNFTRARQLPEPLSEAGAREALQTDAKAIAAEREALQVLDKAVTQALAVCEERRLQSERHRSGRSATESAEALNVRLNELLASLEGLSDRKTEADFKIREDDNRLKTGAELQAQIDAQAAAHDVWNRLSSLIGSADGKRFRNIAQQLTLDILLGYANRHLRDLSRRYRLERVADTLALQVVDQDMGDDVRSVHSLSGGESFLLSLALALGLASLSSNRVRVESLFIDEGFGSLDADTLRVAMDALDSLQSLGRKVGVISHVQEMTERIGTRIEVSRINSGLSRVAVV